MPTPTPSVQNGADPRLTIHRDTNTEFPPRSFETREEWERFAEYLRLALRVSCALYHDREWSPMTPRINGTVVREDYTVERAWFEALPGFFVTGNLYRPRGEGAFPVVACPHGHWAEGRLEDSERGSVPARCITFARMGIVSFAYDMVGYVDSRQFDFEWGHFSDLPVVERRKEHLWGIHPFSVQLWSSLRVLDFLHSLPGVVPARTGCVGASGGGSQTFVLSAVDERVTVSAPVTMISHTMQGGCTCENAPLIRLHASNVEIGAMAAPRPMVMVSATGDWTRATPEVEFPATQAVYALYGAADAVSHVHVDAPHNFNQASREAVYRFLAEHLLGDAVEGVSFDEPPYTPEPEAAVRVFPEGPPEDAPDGQDLIQRWMGAHRQRARKALLEHADDAAWHEKLTEAWRVCMGIGPYFNELHLDIGHDPLDDDGIRTRWTTLRRVLADGSPGGTVATRTWHPHPFVVPIRLVVLVHPDGPDALAADDGLSPGPWVRPLVEAGCVVMAPSVFNPEGREYGRFDDTFAPSDMAWRVQDIFDTAFNAFEEWSGDEEGPPHLTLAGIGEAGLWCWLAAPLFRRLDAVVADTNGFDPDDNDAWADRLYVPSIRSLGGLEAATQLLAPAALTVHNLGGELHDAGNRHDALRASAPRFVDDALTVEALRAVVMAE